MRARRWTAFLETFPEVSEYRILDLGGTADFWHRSQLRPHRVTVVNLTEPGTPNGWIDAVIGDACTYRPTGEFDLVISNSLLEHVGGHARRRELAAVIQDAAPRHWVQTPYRYFPVEPHWLCPGMQFLPVSTRSTIARRWPLAHSRAADRHEAVDSVLWTELIGRTEMVELFPDSHVFFELMLGLPKSLLAVRTQNLSH